jgi:hypothetical protein
MFLAIIFIEILSCSYFFMIDNHFIMFILREVFSDKFKCMSLDNLDFLVMFYLEHKDTILVHYVNDTFEEYLH